MERIGYTVMGNQVLSTSHAGGDAGNAIAMELRGGSIRFGARVGLRGIQLSVASGERVALLGPSGSGKTSLLRAIAGLDALGAGTLLVNGEDVTTAPPERRGTVYLHQTPALFPHLTVLDNVAFPLLLRGHSRSAARAEATALLEKVQLSALGARMPAHLSGGERHRTALARALAAKPAVLLLDEPFSALDPALRAEIRAEVLEILNQPESPAIIVVTHDINEAAQLGQRIAVVLNDGIAQCASADDVVQRPVSLAVARFLGMPNVVPGNRTSAGTWSSILGVIANTQVLDHALAVGWADMIAVKGPGLAGAPAIVTAVEHRSVGRVVRVRVGDLELTGLADADASWHSGDVVSVAFRTTRPHMVASDV